MLAELRKRQARDPDVVPTPWPSWNGASRDEGGGRGMALGWYVVLAGLTGAGKTLAALNLVGSALKSGRSVLLFSLEMSWEQLCTRLRAIVSGEDVTAVERGRGFDPEVAEAADEEFMRLPGSLHLNTEPIWRLDDIRGVMAEYRRSYDVRLVVVDYAQLVEPAGADAELFSKMSEISAQLRYSAKELGCVTVALSQMNRSGTRDRDRSPTIESLFGSSRLGFDADQVAMLDHSRRESDQIRRVERTWLNLAKNRHGPSVEIPVALEKRTLQIREARDHEVEEWP